jgi:hypothetical protein
MLMHASGFLPFPCAMWQSFGVPISLAIRLSAQNLAPLLIEGHVQRCQLLDNHPCFTTVSPLFEKDLTDFPSLRRTNYNILDSSLNHHHYGIFASFIKFIFPLVTL